MSRSGKSDAAQRSGCAFRFTVLAVLGMLLFCSGIATASAGEKFLYGSPELSASISGTNQVSPGETATLNVVIANAGLNQVKIVDPAIVTREDQPNTAKLVTVNLSSGNAPLTVKTDPQMIGDIPGATAKQVTFIVLVADDAPAGTYTLPLTVTYTYLEEAEQYGMDTMRYFYRQKTVELPLRITVTANARLQLLEMDTDHLNVGTEGYLTLTLKNIGYENARDAVVKIVRNDNNSPVIPTESSVYVGDFAPGETITCRYKVSVSKNAEEQTYPLKALLEYKNADGLLVQSGLLTMGVPVGGKIAFTATPLTSTLNPGQKSVIEVEFQNIGAATAYNAQARISAVDPFTSNDDTAYLGDLAPGQAAVARFEVSVDAGATEKDYGLDSEIRYRDALGNSQTSDTMKVTVGVVRKEGISALLDNPIVLAIIAAGLIGTGYFVMRLRGKGASS
ncbi:MAG: COG1361 S-layer family protein [Methanomicrobiales archaeon]|nr:COG1361 S-layer family protein [Methanomicrobiales archaeon]MDI6876396.1 COG1361 S-layer family protein [Methanomicrobiales archaeon]